MSFINRLFGASCSRCNGIIAPTEIVRRAHGNIYHLGCFICSTCNCELRTGDEFYLSDDAHLFCKADYTAASAKHQDRLDDPLDDDDIQLQTIKDVLESHNEDFSLDGADLSDDVIDKIASDTGMESSAVRQLLQQKKKDDIRADNSTNSQQRSPAENANRVHPPTNGYPLPIVNPVRLTGAVSGHHSTDLHHHQINTTMKNHTLDQAYLKSLEELWSNEFVPPIVKLKPEDLLNGDVIAERLLHRQQQQPERSAHKNNKSMLINIIEPYSLDGSTYNILKYVSTHFYVEKIKYGALD
ncbi:Homeobox protein ceh-14 [Bulinus truncatus]|nr:Homeobox protein ceh-14 [Bulinus truncatus]